MAYVHLTSFLPTTSMTYTIPHHSMPYSKDCPAVTQSFDHFYYNFILRDLHEADTFYGVLAFSVMNNSSSGATAA